MATLKQQSHELMVAIMTEAGIEVDSELDYSAWMIDKLKTGHKFKYCLGEEFQQNCVDNRRKLEEAALKQENVTKCYWVEFSVSDFAIRVNTSQTKTCPHCGEAI